MRFDPQANAVPETETKLMPPIEAEPPVLGVRSPLKTAVVIVVIGFVLGGAMWLWSEGGPFQNEANADTTVGSAMNESIIQYAEALINGKTEAVGVKAVPDDSIESRLGGRRRAGRVRAQDEYRSGKLAMGMGEHKQAVAHFEQAIRIKPDVAEWHLTLGMYYMFSGEKGSALDEYKILKDLDQERANQLFNLIHGD